MKKVSEMATDFMGVVATSGAGTGQAASVEKIAPMKEAISERPLALASGVTVHNVGDYLPYVVYFLVATHPVVDVFKNNMDRGMSTHVFAYTHKEANALNEAVKTAIFGMGCPEMFPDGCKVGVKDPETLVPPVFHRNDYIQIVANIGTKSFLERRWSNKIRSEVSGYEGEEEEPV